MATSTTNFTSRTTGTSSTLLVTQHDITNTPVDAALVDGTDAIYVVTFGVFLSEFGNVFEVVLGTTPDGSGSGQQDLTSAFETNGSVTINYNALSFKFDVATDALSSDTADPYTWGMTLSAGARATAFLGQVALEGSTVSGSIVLDDGAKDHAVTAGNASWDFTAVQPTITHTSVNKSDDAGDAAWDFATVEPTVSITDTLKNADAGDAAWDFAVVDPSITVFGPKAADAGDAAWDFAVPEVTVARTFARSDDAGDAAWDFAVAQPTVSLIQTLVTTQYAYMKAAAASVTELSLPTDNTDTIPSGWTAQPEERTGTEGNYRVCRERTTVNGVFDSATDWRWAPEFLLQPWQRPVGMLSDKQRRYSSTVRHIRSGATATVVWQVQADLLDGRPGRSSVSTVFDTALVGPAITVDANLEMHATAGGTVVPNVTTVNAASVDGIEIGIAETGDEATRRRRFFPAVTVGGIVSIYENRSGNWADYLVTSIPTTVSATARSYSIGVSHLEHGDDCNVAGLCKLGFGQAEQGVDGIPGVVPVEITVYQKRTKGAADPDLPALSGNGAMTFDFDGIPETTGFIGLVGNAGSWTRGFPTYDTTTEEVVCAQVVANSDDEFETAWSAVRICESPSDLNTVYKRSMTEPTALADGTARIPASTSDTVPAGTSPVWANTGHRNALSNTWKWFGWVRAEGLDGDRGATSVEIIVYQKRTKGAADPTLPALIGATPMTFNYSGTPEATGFVGLLEGQGDWSRAFPTYSAETEEVVCAQIVATSDNDFSGGWSGIRVCENPSDLNTVFVRNGVEPAALASGTMRVPTGTSDAVPNGTAPVWQNTGHKNALSNTWTWFGWVRAQGLDGQPGTRGLPGADGTGIATLWQVVRGTVGGIVPALPSGDVDVDVRTDTVTGAGRWTLQRPSYDPFRQVLWSIHAINAGTISPSDWTRTVESIDSFYDQIWIRVEGDDPPPKLADMDA